MTQPSVFFNTGIHDAISAKPQSTPTVRRIMPEDNLEAAPFFSVVNRKMVKTITSSKMATINVGCTMPSNIQITSY